MRTRSITGLLLAIGTSCRIQTWDKPAEETVDPLPAINAVLNSYHEAASVADGPRYFNNFNSSTILIGTDASERWTAEEFHKYADPFFSKGQGWTYKPRIRHVVMVPIPCRCVASFDEILDSKSYGTTRGTGMLVLDNGSWKITQYALSVTVPNDLADTITAQIKSFEAKAALKK